MAPRPRFRPAARGVRPFVDREDAVRTFDAVARDVRSGPRVVNYVGVGGIGKSRLLRELMARCATTHTTAMLDLQVPSLRQQDNALAVLRREFGRQKVRFDNYDVAYAVLWQRMHPHLAMSHRELSLVEDSAVLTEVMDAVAGVPMLATAGALLKLIDRLPEKARAFRAKLRSPVLHDLDDMPNAELADAVTYLFAEDLRQSAGARPYALFVDAYEALVGGVARQGTVRLLDVWLRDLVAQLDAGPCVIASREPTRWEDDDEGWRAALQVVALPDLPVADRLTLLESSGIDDRTTRERIAVASRGLPFYLNLAADAGPDASATAGHAVSLAGIIERFLHHVRPEEVRMLELLSLTRVFDHGVFEAIGRTHDLPCSRLHWESLLSYSLVYPTLGGYHRLHQLFVDAVRDRISPEVAALTHEAAKREWDRRRAEREAASEPPRRRVSEVHEAVFHGLRAGRLTGAELLQYADELAGRGGAVGIDPLVDDVEAVLRASAVGPTAEMREAILCLKAETAVLTGAAHAVTTEYADEVHATPSTPAQIRLAVAVAHAERMLGRTTRALRRYTTISGAGIGRAHQVAGVWAADLHMAQGRFHDAAALVRGVLGESDDIEIRADATRLSHLIHRFSFDMDAAAACLAQADELYAQCGSSVGAANVATNRAELLMWSDPRAGVTAALHAIELQTGLAALLEVAKARTALALSYARLHRVHLADAAFDLAAAELDRVRYRSGRARAELFRGAHLLATAREDDGARSVAWAVTELQAAEVYPSLVLLAAKLLARCGLSSPHVDAAADGARATIHPLGTMQELEERAARLTASLLGTS